MRNVGSYYTKSKTYEYTIYTIYSKTKTNIYCVYICIYIYTHTHTHIYIYIYIPAKFFEFSSNPRLKFDGYHGT